MTSDEHVFKICTSKWKDKNQIKKAMCQLKNEIKRNAKNKSLLKRHNEIYIFFIVFRT